MTDAQIKEQLSLNFLSIVAANLGFKVEYPRADFGVDISVRKIQKFERAGEVRFFDTGLAVDFQVKCSTEGNFQGDDKNVLFDLKVKNFNDLVRRQERFEASSGRNIPLVLAVCFLPEDRSRWVESPETLDKIILNAKTFWYQPISLATSQNQHFQRIAIPLTNRISPTSFSNFFHQFFQK